MSSKKIFIQEINSKNFNAGFKARNDCDTILKSLGFELIPLPIVDGTNINRFIRGLSILKITLLLFFSKKRCFIQYPLYSLAKPTILFRLFFSCFKGSLEVLIHDIVGLRYEKNIEPELNYLLKKSNKIIVHTTKMKELLIDKFKLEPSKIKVLYLFDYLTNESPQKTDINGNTIIFAGNLEKSLFISKLDELPNSINFNLYGVYHENVRESANCKYKGKFDPENITAIEGSWGLVWDGDQLETCHNKFGEYLKINSSHKISLYLSACKPVIVWRESSISDFILDNHLGIAINSLYEIPKRLASLTTEEKLRIEISVNEFSQKIRNGEMLKTFL